MDVNCKGCGLHASSVLTPVSVPRLLWAHMGIRHVSTIHLRLDIKSDTRLFCLSGRELLLLVLGAGRDPHVFTCRVDMEGEPGAATTTREEWSVSPSVRPAALSLSHSHPQPACLCPHQPLPPPSLSHSVSRQTANASLLMPAAGSAAPPTAWRRMGKKHCR